MPKLKGLVGKTDIKSNEAIRLNNLNPWTSIWLSGRLERRPVVVLQRELSHQLLCSLVNGRASSAIHGRTETEMERPPPASFLHPRPYE